MPFGHTSIPCPSACRGSPGLETVRKKGSAASDYFSCEDPQAIAYFFTRKIYPPPSAVLPFWPHFPIIVLPLASVRNNCIHSSVILSAMPGKDQTYRLQADPHPMRGPARCLRTRDKSIFESLSHFYVRSASELPFTREGLEPSTPHSP